MAAVRAASWLARAWVGLACLSPACVPNLDSDESTITGPRVIAIQAEPAEAAPNDTVSYRALLVDGAGTRADGVLAWFYCLAQKPLAELGPINKECLDPYSTSLLRVGRGQVVEGQLPADACSLFGPNPPPPVGDEAPGRPVDADITGGYKLPVVLGVSAGAGEDVLLYEQRVACGLAGANQAQTAEFVRRYRRNVNPRVRKLVAKHGDDTETLAADAVLEVSPGERVSIEAHWPSCPERDVCGDGLCGADETALDCAEDCVTPKGCAGQERYVWFDRQARELVELRESLRVAWFSTDGSFKDERTGVDEDKTRTHSDNTWTAPSESTEGTLWVVLRDDRGGVGFTETRFRVR